jgi:hypothetical protein
LGLLFASGRVGGILKFVSELLVLPLEHTLNLVGQDILRCLRAQFLLYLYIRIWLYRIRLIFLLYQIHDLFLSVVWHLWVISAIGDWKIQVVAQVILQLLRLKER